MAQSNNEPEDTAAKQRQRVLPKNPLTGKPRPKTWKEKLQDGDPLNHIQDAQADADFNFRERQRQLEARREFEDRKRAGGFIEADETVSGEDE